MSKPILVYTIISSFIVPWTDFVMAKMILNSGGLFLGLKKADKIPHGLVQIACFFGAHEPSPADQRRPVCMAQRRQAEVVRVLVVLRQETEDIA